MSPFKYPIGRKCEAELKVYITKKNKDMKYERTQSLDEKTKTKITATDTNHHKSTITKGHTASNSPRLPSRDEKVPTHSINITTQCLASDSACFGGMMHLFNLSVCTYWEGVWGFMGYGVGEGKCTLEYIYVCMYGI